MAKKWEDIRPLSQKELEDLIPKSDDELEDFWRLSSGSETEDNLEEDFSLSESEYEPETSDRESTDSDECNYRKRRRINRGSKPTQEHFPVECDQGDGQVDQLAAQNLEDEQSVSNDQEIATQRPNIENFSQTERGGSVIRILAIMKIYITWEINHMKLFSTRGCGAKTVTDGVQCPTYVSALPNETSFT
ncbi:unnamed protein product [Acanthoscelides obtectus]|uniref:Uncharacterized protein n=1 Tax=Acanthoscelides obtectus TaxID=200917 RepID=A0A9P0M0R2_ACAOB|nr:unnamed protein product [Acanthoscelides obtectus]CAK1668519.1 hypothetical protein AOBTE_LOCUS26454 [Acanthoscelides obtectus]